MILYEVDFSQNIDKVHNQNDDKEKKVPAKKIKIVNDAPHYINQACDYYNSGRIIQSLDCMNLALEIDKENAFTCFRDCSLIGLIQLKLGNFSVAKKNFLKAFYLGAPLTIFPILLQNCALNKDFALFPTAKSIIKRNSKILKELGITNDKQKSEIKMQTRLEKDFKEITPLKKSIFRNSIDVLLKAKHKIDEQLYAIKIKKLTNPNEEQSIIAEAQNMKKIRSKHIVEYITCWLDSSVGDLEYLFNENKIKIPKEEKNNNDTFFSSKSNTKVPPRNNFKTFISKDEIKKGHLKKNLYNKKALSDDECCSKKINLDNKFYEMDETKEGDNNNNDDNQKFKIKTKIEYKDDSSISLKKSENQKYLSDLSIYFFIQMEFCQQKTLAQLSPAPPVKKRRKARKAILFVTSLFFTARKSILFCGKFSKHLMEYCKSLFNFFVAYIQWRKESYNVRTCCCYTKAFFKTAKLYICRIN